MVCEAWKAQLDTYFDGELPEEEMRAFDAHVRGCPGCAADSLSRVQMKRAVHSAGKRFAPSAAFRQRMQRSLSARPQHNFTWIGWRTGWMFAAAAVILAVGALTANYAGRRSGEIARDHVYSEIADLHVATLASSSPVDVVSTDRHTVKPWFQGKIPFAFNLPELQNTEFSLLGGRMTYLDQAPGAHLVYDLRKHHISVFVFQERTLPSHLAAESFSSPKNAPFNMGTWSQGGLRYFVIGDASGADIDGLAKLFRTE